MFLPSTWLGQTGDNVWDTSQVQRCVLIISNLHINQLVFVVPQIHCTM